MEPRPLRWIGCLLHLIISYVSAQTVAPVNVTVPPYYDQNGILEIAVQRTLRPTTPFATVFPLTNASHAAVYVSVSATRWPTLSIADYT